MAFGLSAGAAALVGAVAAPVVGSLLAPDAPDYQALGQQQTADQLALNRQTAMANRLTQVTPEGTLRYTQDDPNNPDKWSATVSLSPTNQKLYDADMQRRLGMSDLATGSMGNVRQLLGTPFRINSWGDPMNGGKAASDFTSGPGQPSLRDPRADVLRGMRDQEYAQHNLGDEQWSQTELNDLYKQARAKGLTDQDIYGWTQDHGIDNQTLARAAMPLNNPAEDQFGQDFISQYIAANGLDKGYIPGMSRPKPTPAPAVVEVPSVTETPEPKRKGRNAIMDFGGGA